MNLVTGLRDYSMSWTDSVRSLVLRDAREHPGVELPEHDYGALATEIRAFDAATEPGLFDVRYAVGYTDSRTVPQEHVV